MSHELTDNKPFGQVNPRLEKHMCWSGLNSCLILKDAEALIAEVVGTCIVGVPPRSVHESVESKISADWDILLKSVPSPVGDLGG